ncbi:MAG: hypothetical protein AABY64_14550 [Bdellovibrionota bacterium]
MKSIRSKITKVIKKSNGFPNYTRREYLDSVRLLLDEEFSKNELDFIQGHKINLDKWIMEITSEFTKDLF